MNYSIVRYLCYAVRWRESRRMEGKRHIDNGRHINFHLFPFCAPRVRPDKWVIIIFQYSNRSFI